MKITKNEANLTNWLLSEVALLESTEGKPVSRVALEYDKDEGSVDVTLVFKDVTTTA